MISLISNLQLQKPNQKNLSFYKYDCNRENKHPIHLIIRKLNTL